MYVCTCAMAGDPGGCGPKPTSFPTCVYALAPSKPPVCDAGGAAEGHALFSCAAAAGEAPEELAAPAALGSEALQAQADDATSAASTASARDEIFCGRRIGRIGGTKAWSRGYS